MKKFLLPLVLILVAQLSFGQIGSFFKPLPLPGSDQKMALKASAPVTQYNLRPIADVTATALGPTGAQLAGGFGVDFQANQYDAATNSYITQWSIALLGFIGTDGKNISGIGGLAVGIPGTNGIVRAGPGYDFSNKQLVILTGVGFKLN